jgi:glycosyl transferase family 87
VRHAVVRRAWPVLWRVALLAMGIVAVHKQVRDGNDFPIYWQAARDLLAGRSPYAIGAGLHGYVYLPWFAWALVPLAWLPLASAAWCWYVANLAFTWLAGRALLAAMRAAGVAPPPLVIALAALPLAGLFHDNLMLGQANLLLLLLVALAVRGAAGGFPIGYAAALKMPAGVLALPLVVRGRGPALLGVGLGLVLAIGVPLLAPGGVARLGEWRAKVIEPARAGTLQGSKVIDQSPQAALRRLLVAEPAFGTTTVNVAALDPATFANVSRIVSLVFLAGYAIVWWYAPRRSSPRALLLDFALGCCAMVQLTGFNLKAQFVVLLLPAWLAASLAWERPARLQRVALVIAAALFLLSQPGVVGRAASNWMLACSSMALGTLLLAKVLAWQRLKLPPSDAPAAAPATGTAP